MLQKILQSGTVLFIALLTLLPFQLAAQQSDHILEMIILTREDGSVYILHNTAIPLSHGFLVHRKVENGEWEKLTETPVFPVQNGYQLERRLGPMFTFIAEELNRDDPQGIFLSLRAQTIQNTITHAAIPELARELGRSYTDYDAPIGSQVSYRFEIVNDLERPTGQIIEGSALITPEKPIAPTAVQAENEGRRITLDWQFPTPEDRPETMNTIRFRTFYRDVESGAVEDVTNAILARTLGDRDFRKNFNVPRLEREYEFWVEAVDISGQPSDRSEIIRLLVTDNIAPAIISGVQSSLTDDYESDITWPVSPEIDLAGYHVYSALGEEEEYTRLTDELLPPLQTFYRHADPIPGGQYRYAVTAVDENGNESELSNPTHIYIWDSTTPDPVSGLNAEFDNDQKFVSLNWNEPADAEQLRTFQVLRRQIHPAAGGLYDQVNQTALLDGTIVDTGYGADGFREGVFLEYGVVAVGRNGNRSDTTWTEIQIPVLTPPDPPTSVQTRMRNGESVQVTWNASLSGDVTNYRLYRQETGSEETVLLNESGRGNRFFRDSSIELNREYVFSITAVDSVGNESVPTLAEPIATHRLHPPERTRNVQAISTEEGVILQWQILDDSQVKGYRIYRSGIATGIFEPIGEAGEGELRFIHPESEAGQWFKVFPYDHTGREARTAVAVQAVRR
ncbi:MAG: fibronectin type III domain-containing protein [Balneolaceae bacterium]|nr:fibronectin type III domain-containing protein [Balneolaceae bacterium]